MGALGQRRCDPPAQRCSLSSPEPDDANRLRERPPARRQVVRHQPHVGGVQSQTPEHRSAVISRASAADTEGTNTRSNRSVKTRVGARCVWVFSTSLDHAIRRLSPRCATDCEPSRSPLMASINYVAQGPTRLTSTTEPCRCSRAFPPQLPSRLLSNDLRRHTSRLPPEAEQGRASSNVTTSRCLALVLSGDGEPGLRRPAVHTDGTYRLDFRISIIIE